MKHENPRIGSSLDDLLAEDGTLDKLNRRASKKVLVWQLSQAMKKDGITKTIMSERMRTSRAALDRLLDPKNSSVTLSTLERAAAAVGKRLHIELTDSDI
jgi:DNA-binding Xre family transcriptional regulator